MPKADGSAHIDDDWFDTEGIHYEKILGATGSNGSILRTHPTTGLPDWFPPGTSSILARLGSLAATWAPILAQSVLARGSGDLEVMTASASRWFGRTASGDLTFNAPGAVWLDILASAAWSGTSFPGSPTDGRLFYRTDQKILYFYNAGTAAWTPVADAALTAYGTSIIAADFCRVAVMKYEIDSGASLEIQAGAYLEILS